MISFITPTQAVPILATCLRQHRLSRNMKQTELSEKSGVPLASLRQFERKGKISLESFLKLAFVLDVLQPLVSAMQYSPAIRSIDDLLQKKKIKKQKQRART